jgi:hypothetical protein
MAYRIRYAVRDIQRPYNHTSEACMHVFVDECRT